MSVAIEWDARRYSLMCLGTGPLKQAFPGRALCATGPKISLSPVRPSTNGSNLARRIASAASNASRRERSSGANALSA